MTRAIHIFIVWLVIMLVETVHGTARRFLLEPFTGDLRARQIAVFTGSILIIAVIFCFVKWLKALSAKQLLVAGWVWVVLTLTFEVVIGRFVMDLSWERIFSDYDMRNGGLMPIGLIVMFLAPFIAGKMRWLV